jgi:hypothetical protein
MRLRFVILFLIVVNVGGCIKIPVPTPPDLVTSILGTYKVTTFTIISTQPFPTAGVSSGSVILTRNGTALDTVTFAVSYKINNAGVETRLAQTRTIALRQLGDSFDLYEGTTKIGTLMGSVITVSKYAFSGFTVDFTAAK